MWHYNGILDSQQAWWLSLLKGMESSTTAHNFPVLTILERKQKPVLFNRLRRKNWSAAPDRQLSMDGACVVDTAADCGGRL